MGVVRPSTSPTSLPTHAWARRRERPWESLASNRADGASSLRQGRSRIRECHLGIQIGRSPVRGACARKRRPKLIPLRHLGIRSAQEVSGQHCDNLRGWELGASSGKAHGGPVPGSAQAQHADPDRALRGGRGRTHNETSEADPRVATWGSPEVQPMIRIRPRGEHLRTILGGSAPPPGRVSDSDPHAALADPLRRGALGAKSVTILPA